MAATHLSNNIRYEPDENPPLSVAIGTGIQSALVNLGGIVLGAVIVFRIAGQPESYIPWAIFAALIVSGISTFLQAVRFWRIGSGHVLVMALRSFHRSLRQCPCRGRSCHHGEPHRHFLALPVPSRITPISAAPLIHARSLRHRDHIDCRHRDANCLRHTQ